jgi:uridylate kinase
VGIYSTRLNAEFLRLAFTDLAHESILITFASLPEITKPVVLGAGELPGHSTDYDAVLVANLLGSSHIVNISNIDHVYTADPKLDPSATPIEKLTWAEFMNLLPKDWTPGFHSPFDVNASKFAAEHNMSVDIVNGKLLDEVAKAIDSVPFNGSTITP